MSGRGRVHPSPQTAKRGDRDPYPTDHDDTGVGILRTIVLRARLATRSSTACGRHPCPGQAEALEVIAAELSDVVTVLDEIRQTLKDSGSEGDTFSE